MLCGIRDSDKQKVFARNVTKDHAPFRCPGCHGELIVRKGKIKTHHFAHKPPFNCHRGEGESEAHRTCKEAIYNELSYQPNVTLLDVECDFGSVIADVYCKVDDIPIAIEVQRSNLSVNEITRRTVEYEKLGIHVLWLALYNPKLGEEKYRPKAWEKWCHAAYFGRVYYWVEGLTILPVHFAPYYTHVEATSWYDSDGQEQSGGGYDKASKRDKTPLVGRSLNLVRDFRPTTKKPWRGGSISVPRSRIYCDRDRKWW